MEQATECRVPALGDARDLAAASHGSRAGESCVLVVDDESAVRLFVTRALESAGYAVVGAGDGLEALELLDRWGTAIALVLTDIRMPRVDGLELGRLIARRRLPVPVAYMSADPPEDLACLQKPFSMTGLLELVSELTAEGHNDGYAQ